VSLLVLFDVDGTLLLTHDDVYVEANRDALRSVWRIAPDGPDRPGDTATAHTRRALRTAGIDDDEIDAHLDEWCDAFSSRYVELLAKTDTTHWRTPPDAAGVIAQLPTRALLTGNPEPVALARMERLGLRDLFARGTGAFGCEREDRVALFELARSRAGDWPAERTVGVGDTPLDVSSAHAAGALSVAVTSGAYDAGQLHDADTVISSLAELPGALAALV
jgi:phosphoglycolate phosphatase